ncbi:hypothetical protein [Microcoleus sp.]|jgi:hypothetical protein|uniref:hypothetical protein n=1 Tax=Microcoleus sp. TaxID=44472 RepID=UPI00359464B0
MFSLLTIDFGQTLVAQASFCPHPNWIRIIASIPLILLLVGITAAIAVVISLIVGAIYVGVSSLGMIIAVILFILEIPSIPMEFEILSSLGGLMGIVVLCIQILSGCG